MRRFLMIALMLVPTLAACDREAGDEAPAEKPAHETETSTEPESQPESQRTASFEPPPDVAPALGDEIVQIELKESPAAPPQPADADAQTVLEAPAGQSICVEKVLGDHARFLARVGPDCRAGSDQKIGLYDLDGKRLAEFDRLLDYSKPLAALLVETGRETSFVELATGKTSRVPSNTGSTMYVFVQNRPEVMVFDHPQGKPDRFGFTVVEGLPTEPVAVTRMERRVADHGTLEFNEARKLYEYRDLQTDCWRAAFQPGTEEPARCEARILRGRLTGKLTHWTDHWLTIADPSGATLVASNLYTKEERNPAEGICEGARPVPLDDEVDAPRLLFGCPSEAGGDALEFHLWSPKKTLAVPDGPWTAKASHGRWVHLEDAGGKAAWLDVVDGALARPSFDLAGRNAATRRNDQGTDVFRFDPGTRELHSLGTVACQSDMRFVVDRPDLLVAICGDAFPAEPADECRGRARVTRVEKSYAWDPKTGKRWDSPASILEVADGALLVADTDRLQGVAPCRTGRIQKIAVR